MMNKPKVTVLMTVYNGERYLADAIRSVLLQTFADFEFLIIDDASTDRSEEIILSFEDERIKFRRNKKNMGQTASLNYGLRRSIGEYVARMDQDDLSKPDRLAQQVSFLDDNENVVLVGSWAESIDENGKYICTIRHPVTFSDIREGIACGNPFTHPSVLYRRHEVSELGGYSESFVFAQDWCLWIKLIKNGYQLANLPLELVCFRTHKGRASSSSNLRITRSAEVLRLLAHASDIPRKARTKKLSKGIRFHFRILLIVALFRAGKQKEAMRDLVRLSNYNPAYWFRMIGLRMLSTLIKTDKFYYTSITPIQRHSKV